MNGPNHQRPTYTQPATTHHHHQYPNLPYPGPLPDRTPEENVVRSIQQQLTDLYNGHRETVQALEKRLDDAYYAIDELQRTATELEGENKRLQGTLSWAAKSSCSVSRNA